MRIAVVEDDAFKRDKLVEATKEVIPQAIFSFAKSYKSGLRLAVSQDHDLVLLDMTLPSFDITEEADGGPPLVYGGREILRQMARRRIEKPVILVTQFEQFEAANDALSLAELTDELREEYGHLLLATIYYNPTQSSWRDHLRTALEQVSC